ncbi:MAG: DNA polymerase III subunit alpha [Bacteroidia bacterium]
MILNAHSNNSLRYGVFSVNELVQTAKKNNYDAIAITDINNSTGVLDFVKVCGEAGIKPIAGMEFRDGDELLFVAIARNNEGFREINELMTSHNLFAAKLPERPDFSDCYVIYPYGKALTWKLRDNEYIGVRPSQMKRIAFEKNQHPKYVIRYAVTYKDRQGYEIHKKLRAVNNNLLLSQLQPHQVAGTDEHLVPQEKLLERFQPCPHIIESTKKIIHDCWFTFDFKASRNKKTYTGSAYDDQLLLEKLAFDGLEYRYGKNNKMAAERVRKELEIIVNLQFAAYFLIAWDVIRYSMQKGYYHVGRGSGANSIVAYCLRITDVCPIELDLYFERFLNPKRKSPPDFDIDYSWKERDDVLEYIFKRYGHRHTALLGAMSTFSDRSIIREMGKVYGLPKEDIDRLIKEPNSPLNKSEICGKVLAHYESIKEFPNVRSIHAGGILITEEPVTCYTALDLPPKGMPTAQFDMYTAEDINLDKLDILSQRGIGHINEAVEIIQRNRGTKIDIHDVKKFKTDKNIAEHLKANDNIGCFYIESPAMRGLLKKLKCDNYLSLVAASSIIRPGVARSGMMREYIYRFHNPGGFTYLHPVMEEQLKETYGVMVYQEDVLKVVHHFAGLDLADADVLRRIMSGKGRRQKQLDELTGKFMDNCRERGHSKEITDEVWRQLKSFAGYSFSKAHSASYAVESYQSLYLKVHYPLEFMVAVINNFGGFYNTRIYVNEARKAGGTICLPCVNKSNYYTTLHGTDVYLGFIHIKTLEKDVAQNIELERKRNGAYVSLENFILRTGISLEQLRILIRIDALRFTGMNKRQLLWEAHMVCNKEKAVKYASAGSMFALPQPHWEIPPLSENKLEDVYDEMELLEFPVSMNEFEMLKTDQGYDMRAKDLIRHVGNTILIMGNYVAYKHVLTIRNDRMAFGTFIDGDGTFFDTVNFPQSLKQYPFKGWGVYLIEGKVTEEFGYAAIEVKSMVKLPIKPDPRME